MDGGFKWHDETDKKKKIKQIRCVSGRTGVGGDTEKKGVCDAVKAAEDGDEHEGKNMGEEESGRMKKPENTNMYLSGRCENTDGLCSHPIALIVTACTRMYRPAATAPHPYSRSTWANTR